MQGFYVQQLVSDLHRWAIDVPLYQMKEANAAWQSQNTESLFRGSGLLCATSLLLLWESGQFGYIHTVDWTRDCSVWLGSDDGVVRKCIPVSSVKIMQE